MICSDCHNAMYKLAKHPSIYWCLRCGAVAIERVEGDWDVRRSLLGYRDLMYDAEQHSTHPPTSGD